MRGVFQFFLSAATIFFFASCGSGEIELKNLPPQNDRICCFGDSLVYGTGAGRDQTYPVMLASITGREVINWGTSGDTSKQALAKCGRFRDESFGIVIVTIGGNDILKRVHWDQTETNLRAIFSEIHATGAVIVYTGVTGPLNPTRDKLYRKICEEFGVLYISEILDGIRQDTTLMADAVHPNGKGYRIMAERVAGALRDAGLL